MTGDMERLAILADAFEEAGCTNQDILLHCRSGRDHVRRLLGCRPLFGPIVRATPMSESDWDRCTDPTSMLAFLSQRASDRKLRLFAAACCRRVWPLLTDGRSRRAVEVAERYADEEADDEELRLAGSGAENVADAFAALSTTARGEAQCSAACAAVNATVTAAAISADYTAANIGSAAFHAATANGAPSAANCRDAERAAQSRLLRELFGPLPFRNVPIGPSVWSWNDGTVVRIASAIYQERSLPDGILDNNRIAVLADALEEAGCTDMDILGHLRGPGSHVRGCWIVDLLLRKP